MPVTDVNKDLDALTMTITAEFDGTATMSIQSRFAGREAMEQVIEMGMEQGMVEALGQIDALLAGEGA